MKVMKFGGTSVGSAQRIQAVAGLIKDAGKNIVVLSAMSGTTNTLVEIAGYLYNRNTEGFKDTMSGLKAKYRATVDELLSTPEAKKKAWDYLQGIFSYINSFTREYFSTTEEKAILAQGELMSTYMMTCYLQETGINAVLLPALEFMKLDINGEPDQDYIRTRLAAVLKDNDNADLYITQGFICTNIKDEIDNLQRGGSDYSASLIGAAVDAEEIQIWTDIDGMHNNDPRVVDKTSAVR
ncbi:MAG: aspartate kinase, partial [Bacteroidales bacterium]|nr:aspartate kinase [Bacteroidales bacterium]